MGGKSHEIQVMQPAYCLYQIFQPGVVGLRRMVVHSALECSDTQQPLPFTTLSGAYAKENDRTRTIDNRNTCM